MKKNRNFNTFDYTLKVAALMSAVIVMSGFAAWPFVTASPKAQEAKANNMTQSDRKQKGLQVIDELSAGAGQPALDELREDFPFLADATLQCSLGEVWSRTVLDPKTHQLVAILAFAAHGTRPQMKIHAAYALDIGVTRDELKEVIC
jgi:4-carboxymuconolactone decarboxylase